MLRRTFMKQKKGLDKTSLSSLVFSSKRSLRCLGGFPKMNGRHNDGRKGITSVEFALIAPVFFLFLIGVTEVSLILFTEHLLESAAYNASRTAKTGYVEDGKSQMETVMASLLQRIGNLAPLIDPAKLTMTSTAYGSLSAIGQPDAGEDSFGTAEEIVVYTVSYPWKIFTPMIGQLMGDENRIINLSSRIVVRNEPYE